MSVRQRTLTPIERFLGPAAATGSPFDLLGVSPASASEAEVQAALRRRLARVASRPDGGTPEAGEVRLALHAAAAQLCDPRVRAHLQTIWSRRPGVRRPASPASTPARAAGPLPARSAPEAARTIDMFRASALRILARSGGWNRRSRRRVAALAHAMGLRPAALATALRARRGMNGAPNVNGAARGLPVARVEVARAVQAGRGAAPPATSAPASAASAPGSGAATKQSRLPMLALAALTIAFAVSAALLLVRAGTAERGAGAAEGDGARQSAPATADRAAADEAVSTAAAGRTPTRAPRRSGASAARAIDADVVRRAASALEAARVEDASRPGSALAALATTASGWSALPPDALRSAVAAAARLWTQGARLGVGGAPTLDSPQSAQREAFAAGVERAGEALSRTESTPEALRAFLAGARAQLASSPARMSPLAQRNDRSGRSDAEAVAAVWSAWMASASALDALEGAVGASGPRAAATILALDALERLMTQAPAGSDAAVAAAIGVVAPRVDWAGEGSASLVAARRLLAWFADSRVGPDDLAVLTRVLYESQAIPGMRAEMQLPPHAGRSPRLTQRDRYARLLGVEALASPQALPATWRREALTALQGMQRGGIVRSLRDAAFFARLNYAAAARWAGDSSTSAQITANIHDEIERRAAGDAAVDRYVPLREGGSEDGVWAARVRAAGRNVEEKARALFDIEARAASLGPADADVLALLALSDPEASVRARAQRLIARLGAQPPIINGVLEALPGARRTLSVAGLIEELAQQRLPPPDSEQWLPEAQRALGERLLGALERTAAGEGVDALADAIEEAHTGLLAALPRHAASDRRAGTAQGADEADADSPASERMARALLAEAVLAGAGLRPGATPPAALSQRWRVRAELATGPVQRTTAWATASAEALALLVQAERPGDVEPVRRALLCLAAMQDVTRNSAEQLALAEAGQTVLWMLRFGDRSGLAPFENAAAAPLRSLQAAGSERSDLDFASNRWARRAQQALAGDAWERFELAEEIAEQAAAPEDRALARRLYAAALTVGGEPGVRSVCLGLRRLATSDADRRWLLAMARAAEPDDGPGLFDWRAPEGVASLDHSTDAKVAAAQALLLYRAGERGQARRLLESTQGAEAALREALHGYPGRGDDALVEDLRSEPTCRQCHNARYIKTGPEPEGVRVCPVCQADPGPDLDGSALVAVLRAELALLGAPRLRWSSTLRSADVQPIPVLEPSLLALRFGGGEMADQPAR